MVEPKTNNVEIELQGKEEVLREVEGFIDALFSGLDIDAVKTTDLPKKEKVSPKPSFTSGNISEEIKLEGIREFLAGLISPEDMAEAKTFMDLKATLARYIRGRSQAHNDVLDSAITQVKCLSEALDALRLTSTTIE